MDYPSPATKEWEAWQNLQPPSQPMLTVIGQVQLDNMVQMPRLSEMRPRNINPRVLRWS
jgi:hypothetical protein